ncbi:MAG: alginate lyase family protein [Planctomycetaceae bacterium]|nr:alginate lyase family protein [Planctomycetaceae bacterium]
MGQSIRLDTPLDWKSARLLAAPRLWQFHLHYHEWLFDLAVDAEPSEQLWAHVRHWMDTFSGCTEQQAGDAWHPYCISRRIPAWLGVWKLRPPPAELQAEIARSIAVQTAYLERRLETDLGGNHLLENARSLIVAGATLRNSAGDRWLDIGAQIVDGELQEQVLPHGEHFERSPMYHSQMTVALEDMRDATQALRPEFSARCGNAVGRMHAFAGAILQPDGKIPLLGDSAFDEAPTPRPPLPLQFADGARRIGDYWTFRSGSDCLLYDAGPVGPDHLPAHAHADLLTIEASFAGQRFVVDSGVHDYEDGAMRRYCRSTAAHNVLEIDGRNQCDVYSRFRMGHRGRPAPLHCGVAGGVSWASSTHNGYRPLGVSGVGRWIGCEAGGAWLIADWAVGSGSHTLVNRLHLHPEIRVTRHDAKTLQLDRDGICRWLTAVGNGDLSLSEGWYCPEFGVRIANRVVEFRTQSALPAALGWVLTTGRPTAVPELILTDAELHIGARNFSADRILRISLRNAELSD